MNLLHRILAHRTNLKQYRLKAASIHADPRDAHEAEVSAKQTAAAIEQLTEARAENIELAAKLEKVADQIEASAHRSPERSTAIRKMREAAMWLAREAGPDLPAPDSTPAKKAAKTK